LLDAPDEPGRAAAAGVRRALVRLTPGVHAVTHESIQTAHDESKFGLAADPALAVIAEARHLGIEVAGVHFHVGSQLARVDESLVAVERLASFCERARAELDWTPAVLDIGGGLGIRYTRDEHVPEIEEFVGPLVRRLRERWAGAGADRTRAGALARRPRRRHALPRRRPEGERRRPLRRDRRRDVRQPAAAALRRALRGAARQPGERSRPCRHGLLQRLPHLRHDERRRPSRWRPSAGPASQRLAFVQRLARPA